MALRTPPSWLQQGSHPAENDRLSMQMVFNSDGIIGTSSMEVTANGTPNMSVNVAAGWAAVVGDFQTNMGVYTAYNDATTNLTITASNPSNPRIDRVVITINDAYYSGLLNNVTYTVIAGTPAASPTAPAVPTNSFSLATITVTAGATTITSGAITDTRVTATSPLSITTWTTATRPSSPAIGTSGFNTTLKTLETWNGSLFTSSGLGYWTTATRPASPTTGQAGYNTNLLSLEFWNGTVWGTPSSPDFSPSFMLMGA
jgi:hypothetical protein